MTDDLVYLGRDPLNAEVRVDRIRGTLTPHGTHYVRDHFAIPDAPRAITVDGAVEMPTTVTIDTLRALTSRTVAVTLECAGNGRAFLDPPAPGEQWRLGAVGTAEWTGVPLRDVLERARPRKAAAEVLFVGADSGLQKDLGRTIAYERSLPLVDAMRDNVLLAHAMNGAPIPHEHGGPIRLVVSGWYGMASVKWLARIAAIEQRFEGFFQKDRYVIDGHPLREIAPRAIITDPADGARVARGPITIRGKAWSGGAPVDLVEVSSDNGYSWHRASLGPSSKYAWRDWSVTLETGDQTTLTVLAYAITADGEQQPTRPVANRLGYRNNAAQPITIAIG